MSSAVLDARIVNLSPNTRAVIYRQGVILLRGGTNWVLSDSELAKLVKAATPKEAA